MKPESAALYLIILMSALAGCSGESGQAPAPSLPTVDSRTTTLQGSFQTLNHRPANDQTALPALITYRTDLVPPGAKVTVRVRTAGKQTSVTMTTKGLNPGRMYTAHAHAKPCGVDPNGSGPHYQNVKDTVRPSVDPAYANPANELWLDLMIDANGLGETTSNVSWIFREKEANSVVLHVGHTKTAAGVAGTAGERIACVTTEFGR
ncbi:superoxide dismutase [Amycolatopsis speibonae]|uniref:Superoxide dismutase n=1 Tax=Amycolatopsis speibonae TaxID=1450224 RepID=A0ABV7P2E9_9PSEU